MITIKLDDDRFEVLGFALLRTAMSGIDKEVAMQSYFLLTCGSAQKIIERTENLISYLKGEKPDAQKPDEACRRSAVLLGIWRDMVKARSEAEGETSVKPQTMKLVQDMLAVFQQRSTKPKV